MQTLGLSSDGKRTDGRLKSIFWPTVENAWDVNHLGQQGFWICLVIGVFQLIGTAFIGSSLILILGLIAFMFIGLPLLLKFIARVNPIRHFRAMGPALITAFSTSSSSSRTPSRARRTPGPTPPS